jgi:hypothetical protein
MSMDRYIKIILTIIAVLLTLHLLWPFFAARTAKAGSGIMDVNIVKVDGRYISRGIPVIVIK